MKKLMMLAVTLLAAANLAGCMTLRSESEIKEDGSGTAELMVSVAPEVKAALLEMQALDQSQSQMEMPLLGDLSREDVEKAIKGHDVKVEKFERKTADGRETVTIGLSFGDLKSFSYAMGRVMGGEGGGGMGIYAAPDGNLVLKPAEYDFPPEEDEDAGDDQTEAAAPEMDPAMAQKQMEIAGKLMAAMAELDVRMAITVPGDIISSNAPETDGRTSIWSVNAGNIMTMEQDFSPEIVFSGKGLKIKPIQE